MKYQLLIIFLLGLSLGTAGGTAGTASSAADISGTWAFTITLESGPLNSPLMFVFKQAGEKLTGTQGENKLSGTVKGNKVAFSVEGKNKSGDTYKNTYTGTIESPTKIAGTAEFPKGPGKWTATKR